MCYVLLRATYFIASGSLFICRSIISNNLDLGTKEINEPPSALIPIPLNLFPPQSYVREAIINKICAGIVILYLTNLCIYCLSDKLPRASLKGL